MVSGECDWALVMSHGWRSDLCVIALSRVVGPGVAGCNEDVPDFYDFRSKFSSGGSYATESILNIRVRASYVVSVNFMNAKVER